MYWVIMRSKRNGEAHAYPHGENEAAAREDFAARCDLWGGSETAQWSIRLVVEVV